MEIKEKVINASYKKIKDNDRLILHTRNNQYVLKKDLSENRLDISTSIEKTNSYIKEENNKHIFDLFSMEVILIEEFVERIEEIEIEIKKENEEKRLKERHNIEIQQIEHLKIELKKKEIENAKLKERLQIVIGMLQKKVLKEE